MLSIPLSYNHEKDTGTTVSQIKVNLTNGNHFTRTDHEYVAAGREGNECGARCPKWPHYRCTRNKGHGLGTKSKESDNDHAAHGWSVRRLIVMYARWSQ